MCYAQDCSSALTRAEHFYDAGDFRSVIEILTPCLNSGMNSDEEWRGYRLVAISYIMSDQPDSGNDAIGLMLRYNPKYVGNPSNDPYEFLQALSNYSVYPKFAIAAFSGTASTSISVLQANSLTQVLATNADYSSPLSTQYGFEASFFPWPKIALSLGLSSVNTRLARTIAPLYNVVANDTQAVSSLIVPLSICISPFSTAISPFLEAGAYGQFVTSVSNAAEVTRTVPNPNGGLTDEITNMIDPDASGRIRPFNYGVFVGAGAGYDFSEFEIFLRGRYWYGLTDITQSNVRYSTPSYFIQSYFLSDDISLRGLEFSLGFRFFFDYHEYRISAE
jgi:hypothetical protein